MCALQGAAVSPETLHFRDARLCSSVQLSRCRVAWPLMQQPRLGQAVSPHPACPALPSPAQPSPASPASSVGATGLHLLTLQLAPGGSSALRILASPRCCRCRACSAAGEPGRCHRRAPHSLHRQRLLRPCRDGGLGCSPRSSAAFCASRPRQKLLCTHALRLPCRRSANQSFGGEELLRPAAEGCQSGSVAQVCFGPHQHISNADLIHQQLAGLAGCRAGGTTGKLGGIHLRHKDRGVDRWAGGQAGRQPCRMSRSAATAGMQSSHV